MSIKKSIYLCGCISYYADTNQYHKATEWRRRLINQLLDDIADKSESKWSWFDPTIGFEDNYKAINNKSVLQQNNFYLDKCDILVVNAADLDKSIGSIYEIIYFGLKGKPVIVFNDNPFLKSAHLEPFITAHLKEDKIFTYLDNLYYQ